VARLAASLVEYGWTQPILIADEGTVIAGHGRLLAAQHLGLSDVPVIRLQHLTETQARAYRIGDNQLALTASWDEEALSAELHALNGEAYELALLGFDDGEIERLLAPLDDDAAPVAGDVNDAALDETPAPPRDPVSPAGQSLARGRASPALR
jgi:ParB-like chromosome segregation protein Spo0J